MPMPHKLSGPEDLSAFAAWLAACGAEVLAPERREILRVRTKGGIFTIKRGEGGGQVWPSKLIALFDMFVRKRETPRLSPVTGSKIGPRGRRNRLKTLIVRDGASCWYCGLETFVLDTDAAKADPARAATVEEVCPRQIGGPNHLHNQVVACSKCNSIAGSLNVVEKVRLRERLQEQFSGPGTTASYAPLSALADGVDATQPGSEPDAEVRSWLPALGSLVLHEPGSSPMITDHPDNWSGYDPQAAYAELLGGVEAPVRPVRLVHPVHPVQRVQQVQQVLIDPAWVAQGDPQVRQSHNQELSAHGRGASASAEPKARDHGPVPGEGHLRAETAQAPAPVVGLSPDGTLILAAAAPTVERRTENTGLLRVPRGGGDDGWHEGELQRSETETARGATGGEPGGGAGAL